MATPDKTIDPTSSSAQSTQSSQPHAAPATPPPPTPPSPDPNAALTAYVQQTIVALDSVEVGLGADPALTPTEKRHAVKLRKGGQKPIEQIGNLAVQHQLESNALKVSDMTGLMDKATALQPLADRTAAFLKHIDDVIFTSQSAAWVMAMQYYALLQRRAKTDAELAKALEPVAQFLAYRHPKAKAPGTPTRRQKQATAKAVKALKKTAPQLLAQGGAAPAASTGAPAPAPSPQPAPQPAPTNGANTAAATSAPTNGASAGTATHS